MAEFDDSMDSPGHYRSTAFNGSKNQRRQSTIDLNKRYLPAPTTTQRFHSWHPNPVTNSGSTIVRRHARDTTIWFDNFGMTVDIPFEEPCSTSTFTMNQTPHILSMSSNSSENENVSRNQMPFCKRTIFSPSSSPPSSPLSHPFRYHHQKPLSSPKHSVTTSRLPTFACFFPRQSSP